MRSIKYRRSLDYEVLSECITCEMAYHGARLHEFGDDTEHGDLHSKAMTALIKLEKSVNPDDENTVKSAWNVLRAIRAERKAAAAVAQPIAIAS